MALTYDLGLARTAGSRETLEAVREIVGGDFLEDGRLAINEELFASSGEVTNPISRDVFREEWGFDVAVRVVFAVGHKIAPAARSLSEDRTAIAAVGLAEHLDSDAGFSFQSGTKLMLRRHGSLTLYGDWRPWHEPTVLARIPQPYTREAAPSVP